MPKILRVPVAWDTHCPHSGHNLVFLRSLDTGANMWPELELSAGSLASLRVTDSYHFPGSTCHLLASPCRCLPLCPPFISMELVRQLLYSSVSPPLLCQDGGPAAVPVGCFQVSPLPLLSCLCLTFMLGFVIISFYLVWVSLALLSCSFFSVRWVHNILCV